jgi:multimeric flavodoxin WrbA
MNIIAINGSPHKEGTTALLLEQFIKGAKDSGHQVRVFDAAREAIHPCIGCNHCRDTEDGCIYKDGMESLNSALLAADAVLLVTPIYYFGMSSQLKSVIDRFYANNSALREQNKKIALISACGDNTDWAFDGLKTHYAALCRYLGWEDAGSVLAVGKYVREDLKGSEYPDLAYRLGAGM